MDAFVIDSDALPEWMRTTLVDADGEMYLPCGAFADERSTLLCLLHDRITMARHDGHIYAPASWLAKEHRHYAHVVDAIVARVRQASSATTVSP